MKRKDLILKAKGDVIAEADSFGHGGGFVAVADLTEFKRAVAIGLDLVEISAHADSEQDGIRRTEGLFTSLDILNQYTLGGDADALAVDERLGGALFEILLVDGGVVQVGRAKADLVAHFHDRDAFALLLENETDPVIWRGPVISGVVQQFWTDVLWNCDYLFVDMPPGTGDVSLSVFQSIPLDGIIIVASPQDLVGMVVEKAVKMAEMMNVPIVGLVENMSYVACPDCGKKIYLFGEGKTAQAAAAHNLPLLAEMPIDPALASLTDAGSIEDFQGDWLKTVADHLAEK